MNKSRAAALSAAVAMVAGGTAAVVPAGAADEPVASASAKRKVPRVVGMNHQAAQDLLQSKGFYYLRERDCTGRDRSLIWDRNWKVVRQTPRAGRKVSTSTTITLCSKKYTD